MEKWKTIKCWLDKPNSSLRKELCHLGQIINRLFQKSNSYSTDIMISLSQNQSNTDFCNSFQFSHSILSDSLQPRRLQHARLPCLSPNPGACSNSCPSSKWCLPIISSCVIHFSFSINPSNEYPGLISFRIDWLDLLEVQGTLKRLLQHHSSKASILQHSAFFDPTLTSDT